MQVESLQQRVAEYEQLIMTLIATLAIIAVTLVLVVRPPLLSVSVCLSVCLCVCVSVCLSD